MKDTQEIKKIFRDIGLSLHVTHNTVTTDDVNAMPGETSWRIDHTKEIASLKILEDLFFKNTDTCP